MFRRKFLLTAALAVIAGLCAPAQSQATFYITFTEGSTSITINDNQLLNVPPTAIDMNPLSGFINTPTFTIGDYMITGVNASTTDNPGVQSRVTQNTFAVTTVSTPSADLVVTIFADGFGAFGVNAPVILSNELSTTALDAGMASEVSTLAALSPIATTGPATLSTSGFTKTSVTGTLTASPFSLQNVLTISGLNGIGFTANVTATTRVVSAVPAPASVVMALVGIPAFGLLRLRRRAVAVKA